MLDIENYRELQDDIDIEENPRPTNVDIIKHYGRKDLEPLIGWVNVLLKRMPRRHPKIAYYLSLCLYIVKEMCRGYYHYTYIEERLKKLGVFITYIGFTRDDYNLLSSKLKMKERKGVLSYIEVVYGYVPIIKSFQDVISAFDFKEFSDRKPIMLQALEVMKAILLWSTGGIGYKSIFDEEGNVPIRFKTITFGENYSANPYWHKSKVNAEIVKLIQDFEYNVPKRNVEPMLSQEVTVEEVLSSQGVIVDETGETEEQQVTMEELEEYEHPLEQNPSVRKNNTEIAREMLKYKSLLALAERVKEFCTEDDFVEWIIANEKKKVIYEGVDNLEFLQSVVLLRYSQKELEVLYGYFISGDFSLELNLILDVANKTKHNKDEICSIYKESTNRELIKTIINLKKNGYIPDTEGRDNKILRAVYQIFNKYYLRNGDFILKKINDLMVLPSEYKFFSFLIKDDIKKSHIETAKIINSDYKFSKNDIENDAYFDVKYTRGVAKNLGKRYAHIKYDGYYVSDDGRIVGNFGKEQVRRGITISYITTLSKVVEFEGDNFSFNFTDDDIKGFSSDMREILGGLEFFNVCVKKNKELVKLADYILSDVNRFYGKKHPDSKDLIYVSLRGYLNLLEFLFLDENDVKEKGFIVRKRMQFDMITSALFSLLRDEYFVPEMSYSEDTIKKGSYLDLINILKERYKNRKVDVIMPEEALAEKEKISKVETDSKDAEVKRILTLHSFDSFIKDKSVIDLKYNIVSLMHKARKDYKEIEDIKNHIVILLRRKFVFFKNVRLVYSLDSDNNVVKNYKYNVGDEVVVTEYESEGWLVYGKIERIEEVKGKETIYWIKEDNVEYEIARMQVTYKDIRPREVKETRDINELDKLRYSFSMGYVELVEKLAEMDFVSPEEFLKDIIFDYGFLVPVEETVGFYTLAEGIIKYLELSEKNRIAYSILENSSGLIRANKNRIVITINSNCVSDIIKTEVISQEKWHNFPSCFKKLVLDLLELDKEMRSKESTARWVNETMWAKIEGFVKEIREQKEKDSVDSDDIKNEFKKLGFYSPTLIADIIYYANKYGIKDVKEKDYKEKLQITDMDKFESKTFYTKDYIKYMLSHTITEITNDGKDPKDWKNINETYLLIDGKIQKRYYYQLGNRVGVVSTLKRGKIVGIYDNDSYKILYPDDRTEVLPYEEIRPYNRLQISKFDKDYIAKVINDAFDNDWKISAFDFKAKYNGKEYVCDYRDIPVDLIEGTEFEYLYQDIKYYGGIYFGDITVCGSGRYYVKDYIEMLNQGKSLPPIELNAPRLNTSGKYLITNGHKRYLAHLIVGKDTIPAEVYYFDENGVGISYIYIVSRALKKGLCPPDEVVLSWEKSYDNSLLNDFFTINVRFIDKFRDRITSEYIRKGVLDIVEKSILDKKPEKPTHDVIQRAIDRVYNTDLNRIFIHYPELLDSYRNVLIEKGLEYIIKNSEYYSSKKGLVSQEKSEADKLLESLAESVWNILPSGESSTVSKVQSLMDALKKSGYMPEIRKLFPELKGQSDAEASKHIASLVFSYMFNTNMIFQKDGIMTFVKNEYRKRGDK